MKSYFSSSTLTSWKVPHVEEFSVSTLEGSVRPQGPGALGLLSNSKDTRSDTGALHWCSDLYQRCGQTIFDTKTSGFFLTPQSDGEGHRHTVQLNKPPCTARQCSLYSLQPEDDERDDKSHAWSSQVFCATHTVFLTFRRSCWAKTVTTSL